MEAQGKQGVGGGVAVTGGRQGEVGSLGEVWESGGGGGGGSLLLLLLLLEGLLLNLLLLLFRGLGLMLLCTARRCR